MVTSESITGFFGVDHTACDGKVVIVLYCVGNELYSVVFVQPRIHGIYITAFGYDKRKEVKTGK